MKLQESAIISTLKHCILLTKIKIILSVYKRERGGERERERERERL